MSNIFQTLNEVATVLFPSPVPPDLVFFVTAECNANCEYCLFRTALNDPTRRSQVLTLEEIEKIARNYGGKVVKLSLSGGEPFLRDDLLPIMETFIQHTRTRIIDIPTNGSHPERVGKIVATFLHRHPGVTLEIQLSVDGIGETHDKIRRVPGLFSKIQETYSTLDALRQKNHQLKIKMNLLYQRENQDHILSTLSWMNSHGYLFNRFQIVFPHGAHLHREIEAKITFDRFYALSREILLNYPIFQGTDFHSLLFRAIKLERDNILRKVIRKKSMGRICRAGSRNIVLDDIGNVYPCEPMWKNIGNIRQFHYSMREVCSSTAFSEFKKKFWNRNCHCTWGNIALDEAIFNPFYYPKILLNLIWLLLKNERHKQS